MIVSNSIKGMIAALITTSCLITTANAGDDVSCPSVDQIKGASRALNAVIRQSQKSYFVLSAQPAINSSGLSWMIVTQASSAGFDAAFSSGTSDVKSVSMAMMEQPVEQQGMYICPYITEAGSMSVMAIAQQQQGLTFNPALINLDAIKAKR